MKDYKYKDHIHCFDQQSPACGLGGTHCCLCDIVSKGEDKNGHKINEKGDIIFDDRCNNCDAPKAEVSDWEIEFKKVWKCQHGDCGGGGICQQKRIIDIFKPLIARVRNTTLEEAAEALETLKVNRTYPVTKKFSRKSRKQINVEQRNNSLISAQSTIRSLKK